MKGQDISSDMLMLSLLTIILAPNVRGDPICPPGTYGDTCHKNCSERCRVFSDMNRVYCDKTSGSCAEGCIPGWYDDKCNRECSKNCINSVCNHQTGECTMGCTDGKKGTFCETQGANKQGRYKVPREDSWNTLKMYRVTTEDSWNPNKMYRGSHRQSATDSMFHKAIVDGNLDNVKQLMDDGGLDVNNCSFNELTPLMLAATSGHHDVFEYLHTHGACMAGTDLDGDHILSIACIRGHIDIVKYVVSKEPNLINSKRNDGVTPLMWTAWFGKETILVYLLDNGADCMLMDNDRNTILHYACHGGHTGIAEKVLAKKEIDINSSNIYGKTAVMLAAKQGHKEVFHMLVGNGSDISHKDKDGNNVLHAACHGGHVEIVEYVLSQRVFNINCLGKYGATPLMFAALGGHKGVFQLLVTEGADASLRGNMGNNILHVACMEGHEEMVQHILSTCMVDINSRGQCGRTPLLWAAWRERSAVIWLLVRVGADLLQVDNNGNNILHIACKTGNKEIIRYVQSQERFDIKARNHHDESAPMIAKRLHQLELHELLSHSEVKD